MVTAPHRRRLESRCQDGARTARPTVGGRSADQRGTMGDTTHHEQLTLDFFGAWAAGDFDRVVSYFADDGVYHNIPVDPLTGHEAIRGMIDMMTNGLTVEEFKVLNMQSEGPQVITERVDVF